MKKVDWVQLAITLGSGVGMIANGIVQYAGGKKAARNQEESEQRIIDGVVSRLNGSSEEGES